MPKSNQYNILPKRQGADLGMIRHFILLLIVILNSIFLGLVFFKSTPLYASTTSLTPMSAPVWDLYLVTVNETLTSSIPGQDNNDLIKYGFGVWGWCEIGNNPQMNPACVVKPFWKIPWSAESNDTVIQLDLPDAIALSLSPTGFLLVFPFLQEIALGIVLVLSFGQPLKIGNKPFFLSPVWLIPSFVCSFCLFLPVFVTSVVGIHSFNNKELIANLGTGMILLIIGSSLEAIFALFYYGYEWHSWAKENPPKTTDTTPG